MTRLQIHRTNKLYKELAVRRMDVIFSSDLPQSSAEFLVTTEGITDVPEL